jgi:hypothetical protein
MGIRINKALGWGLTGLDATWRADARLNWDSPVFERHSGTGRDYLQWLLERRKKVDLASRPWFSLDAATMSARAELEQFGGRQVQEVVSYHPEYASPHVLVIRPFVLDSWTRTDDSIDYTWETAEHPGTEDRVQVLAAGIFPFNGLYMDAETGEDLPHDVVQWVRLRNGLVRSGQLSPGDRVTAARLDEIAVQLTRYRTWGEAQDKIVPRVPEEIRDVSEYLNLFPGPDVWKQLRPVLYTYWA